MILQPEQIDHINIINWFNYQYPLLADDFHHFANERKCSPQQGRLLKRMGVKKGVADFFLAIPIDGYAGFWLELKVGKNKLTQAQEAFLKRKLSRGYHCKVCHGFDTAKVLISSYLCNYNPKRIDIEPKILPKNNPLC